MSLADRMIITMYEFSNSDFLHKIEFISFFSVIEMDIFSLRSIRRYLIYPVQQPLFIKHHNLIFLLTYSSEK